MKPRIATCCGLLILVILAVYYGRYFLGSTATRVPAQTVHGGDNVPAAPNILKGATVSGYTNLPAVVIPPIKTPSLGTNRISPEEVVTRFTEEKNVPVEFYGQVIDQDSNALARVDVKVIVMQLTIPNLAVPALGSKDIPLERISGTDGRFEISGQVGASFDIESIQKDGYEAEPVKRGHSPTGGTFEQPVVFKMWSTNIHEQLIKRARNFPIVPDGRAYFIDLSSGSISESESGDLKIWVKRPTEIVFGHRYDWSCEIDTINGGLLAESIETPMFTAPADGYVPTFHFAQKIGSGWGDTTGPKKFYVELNDGQKYAQISIELEAYYNSQIPGIICLSYVLNPSGSHVLR